MHGSRAPNRRIMRRYCDFMRQLSAFQSGGSVHFGATMFHKSLMSKSINLFDESGTEREREIERAHRFIRAIVGVVVDHKFITSKTDRNAPIFEKLCVTVFSTRLLET